METVVVVLMMVLMVVVVVVSCQAEAGRGSRCCGGA
jgi:hypothetical protein